MRYGEAKARAEQIFRDIDRTRSARAQAIAQSEDGLHHGQVRTERSTPVIVPQPPEGPGAAADADNREGQLIEKKGADARLRCRIVGRQLVISIGVETLAHAMVEGPVGGEITRDDEHPDGWDASKLRITDASIFAKEVVHALNDEEEDGSSPLTNLLDQAFRDALDDGAEGVWIRGVLED